MLEGVAGSGLLWLATPNGWAKALEHGEELGGTAERPINGPYRNGPWALGRPPGSTRLFVDILEQ